MIRPWPIMRVIPSQGDDHRMYEVLAEMTEMWWQALQAEGELARMSDDKIPNRFHYLADLAKMQGKRQTWEEAIAVYAGWTGTELEKYLTQVQADKKEAASA